MRRIPGGRPTGHRRRTRSCGQRLRNPRQCVRAVATPAHRVERGGRRHARDAGHGAEPFHRSCARPRGRAEDGWCERSPVSLRIALHRDRAAAARPPVSSRPPRPRPDAVNADRHQPVRQPGSRFFDKLRATIAASGRADRGQAGKLRSPYTWVQAPTGRASAKSANDVSNGYRPSGIVRVDATNAGGGRPIFQVIGSGIQPFWASSR